MYDTIYFNGVMCARLCNFVRNDNRCRNSVISQTINKSNGAIVVSGHTDDIPINTPRYPSNWELSSSRATSIVRAVIVFNVSPARLSIEGHADTVPLESNKTASGRAKNRRVEINIM